MVSLQCSVSCGLGMRRRDVTCKTLETNLVLPLESCNLAQKPKETEKCNPGPCTVTWLASNWSEVGFPDCVLIYYIQTNLKYSPLKYRKNRCNEAQVVGCGPQRIETNKVPQLVEQTEILSKKTTKKCYTEKAADLMKGRFWFSFLVRGKFAWVAFTVCHLHSLL